MFSNLLLASTLAAAEMEPQFLNAQAVQAGITIVVGTFDSRGSKCTEQRELFSRLGQPSSTKVGKDPEQALTVTSTRSSQHQTMKNSFVAGPGQHLIVVGEKVNGIPQAQSTVYTSINIQNGTLDNIQATQCVDTQTLVRNGKKITLPIHGIPNLTVDLTLVERGGNRTTLANGKAALPTKIGESSAQYVPLTANGEKILYGETASLLSVGALFDAPKIKHRPLSR
jgi:hypothetical protein